MEDTRIEREVAQEIIVQHILSADMLPRRCLPLRVRATVNGSMTHLAEHYLKITYTTIVSPTLGDTYSTPQGLWGYSKNNGGW